MLDEYNIESMVEQKFVYPHFHDLINFYTEDYFAFELPIRTIPQIPAVRPDEFF